jgi:hypothetical protein
VIQRTLVSISGSWIATQCNDGTIIKENGNRWFDSVSEAIDSAAMSIAFSIEHNVFQDRESGKIRLIGLIHEATAWGEISFREGVFSSH